MNRFLLTLLLGASLTVVPTIAMADVSSESTRTFKRSETPRSIERFSTTLFTASDHNVATMRGDEIMTTKNTIGGFDLSPIGTSVAIISRDKKGMPKVEVYSALDENYRSFKFDSKKYGVPSAVAFTPDSRALIIATDRGLQLFDTRKFQFIRTIDVLDFVPDALEVSSNGYYIAASDPHRVAIINFEDKTLRTTLNYDEKVTCVAFSNSSDDMGVLTDDGLLTIYDTRTFRMRTTVDDLGEGLAFAFNDNGKYVAVATSPGTLEIINLLRQSDRRTELSDHMMLSDISFLNDSLGNTMIGYTAPFALSVKRVFGLEPYYSRLVSDEVDGKMNEWLKMLPGESMEEYQMRVNDASRSAHRRLLEDEISTDLAGDLMSMASLSLGNYDRANQVLAVGISNMPTIYLPVPESDIPAFHSGDDLTVSDARYGLLPDDSFELIYGKFTNRNDGKTYVYDNVDRVPMTFLEGDDNVVSIEIIQQQQIEEMKLQEIKEKVVAEARHDNVISNHTDISIDSQVVPDYDANGNKILNYVVKVSYTVDPEFSAIEDFGPGKYHIEESGAASSMANIVTQAFEGDLAQYLKNGKRLRVKLSGSADSTPIVRGIPYDGSYGDFEDEPVWQNGQLAPLTVTRKSGISTNEQLAFLRAQGVKDYLEKNVEAIREMNRTYDTYVDVATDKGSHLRRISAEFTFVDAF